MVPNRHTFRVLIVAAVMALGQLGARAARSESPRPASTRVAVVIGANAAAPGRVPLLFGHADAQKMAAVLTSVAGFRREDVLLLEDPNASDLMLALRTASARLTDRPESLLYFYYSGHADEDAIYPGGQRVPLAPVRALMDTARVSVRIGMVDACHGGGWTRAKGLTPDEPFPVRWPLSLDNEGSVLIASSSGLESAHESDRLRGSFFTHHFAIGLRGAADRNGNGEVALTEAFEYAKERTIRDTVKVARGPQHPSYAVNLRGRRDLVLAQLNQSSSALRLTQEQGPLELIHVESGVSLLELPAGPRTVRLAVPPGAYFVRKKVAEGVLTKEVAVTAGTVTTIDEGHLTLVGNQKLVAKSARPTVVDPPQSKVATWIKVGAVSSVTAAALSFALAYKYAQDVAYYNDELEPFRRYPCPGDPAAISCAKDGTSQVPLMADQIAFAAGLHADRSHFQSYRNKALVLGAGFTLLSVPFFVKWIRGGSARANVATSWFVTPHWAQGPGVSMAARF